MTITYLRSLVNMREGNGKIFCNSEAGRLNCYYFLGYSAYSSSDAAAEAEYVT